MRYCKYVAVLAVLVFVLVLGAQAQSAEGNVITINGQRYVLVPEKTFPKLEKMVVELPARRDQVTSLTAENKNLSDTVDAQEKRHALDTQANDALTKALDAETRATQAEKEANEHNKAALAISEKERERLMAEVKKWKKRATLTSAIAAFLGFIVLRH